MRHGSLLCVFLPLVDNISRTCVHSWENQQCVMAFGHITDDDGDYR